MAYETSTARTLAKLRSGGMDALVIDGRGNDGAMHARALLEALFDDEVSGPIARRRTWLVVDRDAAGIELGYEAGRRRVAGVAAAPHDDDSWLSLWNQLARTAARSRSGKIALCLAGGGTEGLLYELGVLRALQKFLPDYDLSQVDLLCGISAGAILGALLANGMSPNLISEGLRGRSNQLDPISRTDLFDLNIAGLAKQALGLGGDLLHRRRSLMSALFRLPPAGLFAGQRLHRWLERQLSRPGMVDQFEDLPRRLFIGATDQDSGEHVLFGSDGAPRVPIHQAVRASIALAPFYAPAEIDGRYYIDGGFTRTTNMRVAVKEGATMVILIEPLVPMRTGRAGYVAERGAIYAASQGLKSLINARFAKALPTLRSMFPEVSFHLFQPSGISLRMLSGSPMKFWYREAIEQVAHDETMREIRTHRALSLARDFARHGIRFEDPDGASLARASMLESIPAVA